MDLVRAWDEGRTFDEVRASGATVVSYPADFGVENIDDLIARLTTLKAAFRSPEATREILNLYAPKLLGRLDAETVARIVEAESKQDEFGVARLIGERADLFGAGQ
jgi:hypothetical protein